jgi:hypothetical protein
MNNLSHKINVELENIEEILKIITDNCKNQLGNYLAFRHFFSHAYALDLYSDKIQPLVENMAETFRLFKVDINKYL